MTLTLAVKVAGRSHIGLVRRRNEDSLYLGQHLVAVADGMGGHVSGDVASQAVVEAVATFDAAVPVNDLPRTLARAVAAANVALHRRIAADPEVAGMGATLVALAWSGSAAALAHIGDSRAYLLRDGRMRPLTEDHVYANLVSNAERVPTLAERLSRYLDGRPDGRSADITTHELRPGDRFLLCSDGLSSYVDPAVIARTLAGGEAAEETADRLIELALEAGGHDNVTVVVVRVRGGVG